MAAMMLMLMFFIVTVLMGMHCFRLMMLMPVLMLVLIAGMTTHSFHLQLDIEL
jgi:hypothetical protein